MRKKKRWMSRTSQTGRKVEKKDIQDKRKVKSPESKYR